MELKLKLENGQLFINDKKVTEIHFDIYEPLVFPITPGPVTMTVEGQPQNMKNIVSNSTIIQQHSGVGDNVAHKTTTFHIGDIVSAKFE